MSEKFTELNQNHINFIHKQQMYFVATAGAEGLINLSPKGMDSFRIINESKVIWLNLTGSGNETAAHVLENKRMTMMFCSFAKQPLILRLYGNAKVIHPRDKEWNKLLTMFPEYISSRQIFELDITLIQTSCGYGIPLYDFNKERPTLLKTSEKKGKNGTEKYWQEKNTLSLDGKETGILEGTKEL